MRVGLCINERKKKKMKFSEVIDDCTQNGIDMISINMDDDIESQGPFDIIIHKVLDFSELSPENGIEKTEKLRTYVSKHKETVMVDSVELSEQMADRIEMTNMLKKCEFTVDGISVFVPKSVLIDKGRSVNEVREILTKEEVEFPILAKPVDAQCNNDAHNLTLIFSEQNLSGLQLPSLVQEFRNHGGVLYKIFLVGDQFRICERPSIKNFISSSQPNISFDTRDISKTGKPFDPTLHSFDPQTVSWKSCDDEPNLLNMNVARKIVHRLRSSTGVSLVGIDIIIEEGTGNYGIIDMNYFPGYDGVRKHFNGDLINFLKSLAK